MWLQVVCDFNCFHQLMTNSCVCIHQRLTVDNRVSLDCVNKRATFCGKLLILLVNYLLIFIEGRQQHNPKWLKVSRGRKVNHASFINSIPIQLRRYQFLFVGVMSQSAIVVHFCALLGFFDTTLNDDETKSQQNEYSPNTFSRNHMRTTE